MAHRVDIGGSAFPAAVGGRADAPPPTRKLRVNRVSAAVVEGNFGRVDNVMTVELPADTIPLINCPVR